MMRSSILYLLVFSFLLCTFLPEPVNAVKKPYIVYMGGHSHGPNPSPTDMESATNSHYDLLSSVLGSYEKAKEAIFYSYNKHINGFAAVLEEEEAEEIKKNPKVVSVFLSKAHKLHTTRSWEFLGLDKQGVVPAGSAWNRGRFGENTIIGNLDTGVWPESQSFSDRGFGPIPPKWRGNGACQVKKLNGSNDFACNRKLIGARYFIKGYEAHAQKIDRSLHTARDNEGHGTHTLSTAGGNFVSGVTIFGNGNGTAKGGSPRARVAAYKVCWSLTDETNCFDADIIDAFDHAIDDGVDVLSVSVGGFPPKPVELLTNGIAIGSFHAVAKGIPVVCSAGNDGPEPETVSNVAPWILTVAASTIDREITNNLALGGKRRFLKGASLSAGLPGNKFYTVIRAMDAKFTNATDADAQLCKPGTLDPNKVKGKLLTCLRAGLRSVGQGQQASLAGAVGMILLNDKQSGNTISSETHVLSTTNLRPVKGKNTYRNSTGQSEFEPNLNSTEQIKAYMSKAKTYVGLKPAPVMASFSSKGPNVLLPSILKPDITAPGLDILAAYSKATSPSNLLQDSRRVPYNLRSGTSQSCPHVAGVVGLLRTLHPDWSPAAIKSAIMTTATPLDNNNQPIRDAFDQVATPFDYGAGHIQPNFAMDPGLVYDLQTVDYLNLFCASGYDQGLIRMFNDDKPYTCPRSYNITDFNYPSITLPNLGANPVTVTRRVKNVGPPSTYFVGTQVPEELKISVQPKSLTFTKTGETKSFQVILGAAGVPRRGKYLFGALWWTNGKHKVRSPIVVQHRRK